MKRKHQITLGILHLFIFVAISVAEFSHPIGFGISHGVVIDKQDNSVSCFGEEHAYDAQVLLDIYSEYQLVITTTYLSNRIVKGEREVFIYWGSKIDIATPLTSLSDDKEYVSDVQIALVTFDSLVFWYYILYQVVKWFSLLSGIVLFFSSEILRRKTAAKSC
jgi:hypothetical protein